MEVFILMKNLFRKLLVPVSALALITACATTPSTSSSVASSPTGPVYNDPAALIVQFVPSTSIDATMLTRLKNLEGILSNQLKDKGFNTKVNISVGTSYASVVEGMVSGQIHVGFLTSQQYAFTTIEYPGKVEVLLTSVRDAYAAQIDANGNEITDTKVIAANSRLPGYAAQYHPTVKATSYYSMLLVRTADYNNGLNSLEALAGKVAATQSNGSGSGYQYPAFEVNKAGMKFVTGTPNAANKEIGRVVVGGHQNSILALLNNEVDAVFTFFDARLHATAFNSWLAANPGKNIFQETTVVSLTSPIFNDTISGVTSLSPQLREAIKDAFIGAIAIPEGKDALLIYNHSAYKKTVDKDYDGERAFYKFLQALG